MNTTQVIRLAREQVDACGDMESSARLCLANAIASYDLGAYDDARAHALRSLRYSIGILNSKYRAAIL